MIVGVVLTDEQDEMAVVQEDREVMTVHLVGIRSADNMFFRFLVHVLEKGSGP